MNENPLCRPGAPLNGAMRGQDEIIWQVHDLYLLDAFIFRLLTIFERLRKNAACIGKRASNPP